MDQIKETIAKVLTPKRTVYSVVGIIVLYVLKRLMGARSARKVADARKAAMDSRSAVARGTTPAALSGVNMSSGLSTTPAYTKAGGSAIQTSSAAVDPAHHTASHPSVVEIPMAKIIRGTTRYVLKCSTVDGRQWAIAKRYSEFDKLKDDLTAISAMMVDRLHFPSKSTFGGANDEVVGDRITELRDWINAVMVMADLTAEVSEKVVDERDPFQEAVLDFLAEDHSIEDDETLEAIGLSREQQLQRSESGSPMGNIRLGDTVASGEAQRLAEMTIAYTEQIRTWPKTLQDTCEGWFNNEGWQKLAEEMHGHHCKAPAPDGFYSAESPQLQAEILELLMRPDSGFEARVRAALNGATPPPPSALTYGAASGSGGAAVSACPPGSWPALKAESDYRPVGSKSMLGDLPIYTVGSPGDSAVLVFADVFGPNTGRHSAVADQLASEGYFVVMPDHMRGAAMGEGDPAFLQRYTNYPAIFEPDLNDKVLPYLKQNGVSKIAAIGFCSGAWVAARASAAGVPLLCAAGCHPSLRLEGMATDTSDDEVGLIEKVKCPMLFANAGDDPDNIKQNGAVSTKLMQRFPTSVVRDFPAQTHGFVVRGDVTDDSVARGVREAMTLCTDFIGSHMGRPAGGGGGAGGMALGASAAATDYRSMPSAPVSAQTRVADWLAQNGLQSCVAVLADLGYDEGIDMLIESDAEEQADMIRAVSSSPAVKKPIAKKFERELGKLRGQ